MMVVVGYYDMRPVDWASGRRMPLSPGEGHVCDRCGAEHAVVYVVTDTETGSHYRVGSSCAQAQFGFDVGRDAEAKKLVKTYKQQAEAELDQLRQKMVAEAARQVASEIRGLEIPPYVADTAKYPGVVCIRCGDGMALERGRTEDETKQVALQGWVEHRVAERVPAGWNEVEVVLHDWQPRHKVSMARKLEMLVMKELG